MATDFENVGFSNNFMFGKIMENPDRAKAFLEQILNIKIDHVEYIEREKGIDEKYDGRSIRMDIYAADKTTVYDCEMQTTNAKNLPKRSRYYQSLIDIGLLRRNDNFRLLKKSYVIFICTFDPFEADQYIYSFENKCKEVPDLLLEDEAYKIFINTKGSLGDVSEEFKELLRFIDTSEDRLYQNSLANELLADLKRARNNEEWRDAFMTWDRYGKERLNEGIEQGIEQANLENARKMLNDNLSIEKVAQYTGLDISTVESIKKSLSSLG